MLRLGTKRFAASWTSSAHRDGEHSGIFGAVFDGRARRLSPEFQVNLRYTDGNQHSSSLAPLGDGFLVVCSDEGDDVDSFTKVSAQRFDKQGNRLGDELVLAEAFEEYGFYPEVAGLQGTGAGRSVVVWESLLPENPLEPGYNIAARIVSADGTIGERIRLTDAPFRDEGNPSVAAVANGFVATWSDVDVFGSDVYARRFSNDGVPVGEEFRVNTYTDHGQFGPLVATAPDGRFVIIWASGHQEHPELAQDGDDHGLFGQAFAPDGTPLGREFQVSTKTVGRQGDTASINTNIAFINDTDFVAVWQDRDFRQSPRLHGRRFRLSRDRNLCGDTTGADLTVGIEDAFELLRTSVGLGECPLCNCDVDGSGTVDGADAVPILRRSVGLEDEFSCPICPK